MLLMRGIPGVSSPAAENAFGYNPMLLCDFHIHTKYSDGILELPEVVDLFGRSGHDVIGATDPIVDPVREATA
jgi:hypothetical protein